MEWLKKLRGKEQECKHHLCQCGGKITRQTTLLEFFPDLLSHDGQRKITDWLDMSTTESVGMGSKPRKYRGSL